MHTVIGRRGATAPEPTRDLADGYRPGTPEYRRVVAALFAAGLATFTLLYSTQAVLPELTTRFGVREADATLAVSLTTLGLGLALLVAGPWSDVRGRTALIHLSLAGSAVVALACALAPSWGVLLALRLLLGVTLAGLPAVATAYLREELHPSSHARAAGLYVGGTAIGGMAGRLVTGGVAELGGWRWALVATAAVSATCALVVWRLLPASRNFRPGEARPRAMVAMARRAVSDPALLALYAVGGCTIGALVSVFNTIGFRLAAAPFDLGLAAASLVFLVYPLGSVSSVLFGRLADARGRRSVIPLGCVIAVAGALLTLTPWLPLVVAGLAVLISGFFAVHGVASGWVPARAHAGGVSTAQAASLYLCVYYLGSSVFGSAAGAAWHVGAWPGVVALTVALLAVSSALTLRLRRIPAIPPVTAAA